MKQEKKSIFLTWEKFQVFLEKNFGDFIFSRDNI